MLDDNLTGNCYQQVLKECSSEKMATRVRSRVAAGLPTGYSVLGDNLTGYCYQQYQPRQDDRAGNDTHRGLGWKQVVLSIPGGDFRRLPTLNKRLLPLPLRSRSMW